MFDEKLADIAPKNYDRSRVKRKGPRMFKGGHIDNTVPISEQPYGSLWKKIAHEFSDSDGVLWNLYFTWGSDEYKDKTNRKILFLKLVAKTEAAYKANYWIGFEKWRLTSRNGHADILLDNRPELFSGVTYYLRDYVSNGMFDEDLEKAWGKVPRNR